MTRRSLLIGIGSAFIGGCGTDSSFSMAGETFKSLMSSSSGYPRTREQVDALPYAQLGVQIGHGGSGIMVLKERVESDLMWLSANRLLLVTRNGRIVRTVGLQGDLTSVRFYGADPIALYDPENPKIDGAQFSMSVDAGSRYAGLVSSRFYTEAVETIDILKQATETLRVREELVCDDWKWKATNRYWLSRKSNLVWRSQQNLVPGSLTIETEILKRAET